MDVDAIKTIRIHNWKWPRTKAEKFAKSYLGLIQGAYPTGIEGSETYFVLPGFEHVTKHQPVVAYNPSQGEWELQTRNLFVEPTHNKN